MEIRWMVLAKASKLATSGALDISQIFEHYRTPGPPFSVSFLVLFKIVPDPLLAGTKAGLTLRISNPSVGYEWVDDWDYEFPTWDEWLGGFTPFHQSDVDLLLLSPGEYAIDLLEGDSILASEGFKLIEPKEGSDAEFRGKTRSG